MLKNHVILIILSCFLNSCSNTTNSRQALENINAAERNSSELNKILTEYRYNSDKTKAAEFLIANMNYKYTLAMSNESLYVSVLDSLSQLDDPIGWDPYLSTTAKYLDSVNLIFFGAVSGGVSDLKNITFNDLKNNIDLSFKVWSTSPWGYKYSFNDFCRWVLPYRGGSEKLEDWRRMILDSSAKFNETDPLKYAIKLISNTDIYYNIGMANYRLPLSYSQMRQVKRGSCDQMALYALLLLRGHGIPSAIDCTPVWANRSSGHVWNAVILPNGKSKDINYHPEGKNSFAYKLSKVYRQSFEVLRNDPLYQQRETEDIPPFFSEFNLLDVTSQYDMPLSTVKIDNLKKSDSRLVWLCTFDNHKWVPVAYTEKCWGKATFENVARGKLPEGSDPLQYINAGGGIVYLPAYYIDNEVKPASEPFILYENGNVKKLTPDTINTQALVIGRKYPKHPHFDQYEKDMIGGRFEVSNRADFRDAKTIFTITRQQKYPMERFDLAASSEKYKYVRYIARDSIAGNVAEMKFYSWDVVCNGSPIGVKGDTPERGPKALFDDNMESFYYSTEHNFPVWAGLDFGKRESITGLAFAARTDDNEVRLGDTYQLYYWVNGWREADTTVAGSYTLRWSGVPGNTIYLLKNLSRGVEHRPFTYENGVQVWW